MKKIYSLLLTAAALLVGTNAWAGKVAKIGSTEYETLEAAWADVQDGQTIELIDDCQPQKTLWLGTETMADQDNVKSITLDLGDHHDINFNFSKAPSDGKPAFFITHGSLNITGKGTITVGNVASVADGGHAKSNSLWVMFQVTGSTYKMGDPSDDNKLDSLYTHLTIDDSVTIDAQEIGITVDNLTLSATGHQWPLSSNVNSNYQAVATYGVDVNATPFNTKVYTGTPAGLAYGVRIDMKGHIIAGKYGIKANSELAGPSSTEASNYTDYKVLIDENGDEVAYSEETKKFDKKYAPFIKIWPRATVTTVNVHKTGCAGIYSGGYARWQIEGICKGSTGAAIKSGEVVLAGNAEVESNYEDGYNPGGDTGLNRGIKGGGSGLVITSSDIAVGDVELTITGNATVTGAGGYAIEECISTSNGHSEVESISIQGGTIEQGANGQGIITVTTETRGDASATTVSILGGTFEGDEDGVTIGAQTLQEFLETQREQGEDTHGVIVYVDPVTNEQTVVISPGPAPVVANSVIGAVANSSINWINSGTPTETLVADKKLAELQISQNYDQVLTINPGVTLEVGRVVLGAKAQIIVKPGAKFVVTGDQGLAAYQYSNVILENEVGNPAIFFFHPDVTANIDPKATVKLSIAKGLDANGDNVWTRFGMPLKEINSASLKNLGFENYFYGWNYTANEDQGAWELVANVLDMKSWTGYTVSYGSAGEQVYTFRGNLVGNADAPLNFVHRGFNYFGNSYMGYIDSKTLVESLPADIDGTVYLWNTTAQQYNSFTMSRLMDPDNAQDGLEESEQWAKDIEPMSTFILRLMDKKNAAASVDYTSALWENPRHGYPAAPAPRRATEANYDQAIYRVVVTAANGTSDRLNLTENSDFTDAYDRGYDAAKFMNTNSINLFATINGENYSDVVTNSLEGKMISIETVNEINYKLSFSRADNNEYAIRDNVTGQVINMEEGVTYEFTAQPNSLNENRFEILPFAKIPTAIDNTEVVKAVKGIYTITGQYLGENFEILPAGVYVINGVKVVK